VRKEKKKKGGVVKSSKEKRKSLTEVWKQTQAKEEELGNREGAMCGPEEWGGKDRGGGGGGRRTLGVNQTI